MALVVASTSTVSTSNADSLTITKPSGVQSGDLLIICALGEHDGSSGLNNSQIGCTGFTRQIYPSGPADNVQIDLNIGAVLLWKIADAGDVSASNYSITLAGSETLGIAAMFRITGWTSGNPIFTSHSVYNAITASSLSLVRPTSNLLIMLNGIKQDDKRYSFASPSITSGGANPSWTEVIDANVEVNFTTDSRGLSGAVYYANDTDISNITAYSITETNISGAGGVLTGISFLAVIAEPQNITSDVSHLAVTPSIVGVTASQVNVAPDVSHLAITPTINGVEATNSSDRTQWTNETKPADPTWINKDK